ncbi:MAG: TolC family protein [Bacteroidales bacterium]|nr:TolC family protein [Bacteroidales bacterium]
MRILIIILCVLSVELVSAQDKWTLQQCVDHALTHSIQIRQKVLAKESAETKLNTSKNSWLPDLNAGANQNFDFGRSTSRDGVIRDVNSMNLGLSINSSMPLFTGFRLSNQIEANRYNLLAANADIDKTKEAVALYVASGFLQVVYNKELNKVAIEQAKLSADQMQRTQILVSAGKLPESELFETRATNARDESEVTKTKSNLQLSLLDLAQLMEVEKIDNFDVDETLTDGMMVTGVVNIAEVEQTYHQSISSRPSMKEAEYRLEEGKRNLKIAKSGYYPTLSLGASYSNGYYYTYNLPVGLSNTGFGDQINQNGRNAIGLSLNIPIFNRFETRNQVKQAIIAISSSELNVENTRKELLKDVQQAYYNAVAARDKYNSAEKSLEASNIAYQYARDKFESGKSTSFEFNESNNRRLKSLSEKVQAKYDFIFRCKILDFYNGKSLY